MPHSQVQRGDGLFGGLVVHRPAEAASLVESSRYDYDEEALLLVGDWFHASAEETLEWYTSFEHLGNEPVPDSLLLNGRGRFNCSLAVLARPVACRHVAESDLTVLSPRHSDKLRLRVVNTGTIAGITISIGGALMTVLTVDGGAEVAARPAAAAGILYPGERMDVLVEWPEGDVDSRLFVFLDPE